MLAGFMSMALLASDDKKPLRSYKLGDTSYLSIAAVPGGANLSCSEHNNQMSSFQKMFNLQGEPVLAEVANGLYAHATEQQRTKLDNLFKHREPQLTMRSKRKGPLYGKESADLGQENPAAEMVEELIYLVSSYVEKEHKKPKESLGRHYASAKKRNCCTMITSAIIIIGTNALNSWFSSYTDKKCH